MKEGFHQYEGYTLQQVTFPSGDEGARRGTLLISTRRCVESALRKGDVMVISDHINLLGDNPLIGRTTNPSVLGSRYVGAVHAFADRVGGKGALD